jgi:hypothetical protein
MSADQQVQEAESAVIPPTAKNMRAWCAWCGWNENVEFDRAVTHYCQAVDPLFGSTPIPAIKVTWNEWASYDPRAEEA